MKKSTQLRQLQERLPDDIIIQDETTFEFSEDEFLAILSWIKYFNAHYKEHGKKESPSITYPIISKRLRLDFGLYRFPSDIESNRGNHVVYISNNNNSSVRGLINIWKL